MKQSQREKLNKQLSKLLARRHTEILKMEKEWKKKIQLSKSRRNTMSMMIDRSKKLINKLKGG